MLREGGVMLVLDHGSIGFPPLPGHGHADALAIWLHVNDVPILIDVGTVCYNRSSEWRTWIRSTDAHNTLSLAGKSQSVETGPFNWGNCAQASLEEVCLDAGFVQASHDGYVAEGALHRRCVSVRKDGFTVKDELEGTGIQTVRISFHFAQHIRLKQRSQHVVIEHNGKEIATLENTEESVQPRIVHGNKVPGPGLHSLQYNDVASNISLVWEGEVLLPCSWNFLWVWLSNPEEIWHE